MSTIAYCGACGAQGNADDSFCAACGARQDDFAPPEPQPATQPAAPAPATSPPEPEPAVTTAGGEIDRLTRAIERAEHDAERPAIDGEVAAKVYEAAHAARDAGHDREVDGLLEAARERAAEHPRRIFTHAYLQENDREFRDHGVEGLEIRRVMFTDGFAGIDDLDLACVATAAGSFVPKPQRADERTLITVACELQLFVPNTLPDDEAAKLHQRGFDHSDLSGSLALHYDLRLIRRAAWGSGFCVLTDRRAIGLLIDDEVTGVGKSPERSAMPYAIVEGDGSGSVIAFSIERALFEDCEISSGLLQNRIPYVNLTGDCPLAVQTLRVVDDRDRLVRPPKNAMASAVRAFVA